MNNHLIRNFQISILWDIFIIAASFACFYFLKPEELFYYIFLFIFIKIITLWSSKVLLEILQIEDEIIIKSYSIFRGKRELKLKLIEITEIDYYSGLIIKYKKDTDRDGETYKINAEPWNSLYGQIKNLKLSFQEYDKTRMVKL